MSLDKSLSEALAMEALLGAFTRLSRLDLSLSSMLIEDLFEAALGKLSCLDMSEEIESVFFTAPMEAF